MAFVTRGAHGQQTNFPSSFSRARLLAPRPPTKFSNACGESDGTSVERREGRDLAALTERANAFALRNPDRPRIAEGFACAGVGKLREIRVGKDQEVFVYDDPGEVPGPLHAVIRVKGSDGPTFLDIRNRIVSEFKGGGVSIRAGVDWAKE